VVEGVIDMPATEERVSVTLELPRRTMDRISELAGLHNESLTDRLEAIVEKGLDAELSYTERFDRLSEMYRARLKAEGKLDQTDEEVLAELREVRERIANEPYPV
jgi:histidinol dehydrogenase